MEKEEKYESEERMSKVGKPAWYSLSPISWPPPDSKYGQHQEMHKTFASDEELKEHMTATYWG